MTTFIGLVRDFIVAAIGVAILFGADFTEEQIAGILLVVSTGLALGSFLYQAYRNRQSVTVNVDAGLAKAVEEWRREEDLNNA